MSPIGWLTELYMIYICTLYAARRSITVKWFRWFECIYSVKVPGILIHANLYRSDPDPPIRSHLWIDQLIHSLPSYIPVDMLPVFDVLHRYVLALSLKLSIWLATLPIHINPLACSQSILHPTRKDRKRNDRSEHVLKLQKHPSFADIQTGQATAAIKTKARKKRLSTLQPPTSFYSQSK